MPRYLCMDLLASESVASLKEKLTKLVQHHYYDIAEALGDVPWLAGHMNLGLLTPNVPRKLVVETENMLELIDEIPDKPDASFDDDQTLRVVTATRDHIRQVFLLRCRIIRELELGKLRGDITDNTVENAITVDIEYWESNLERLEFQVFELEDFVMFFPGWRKSICELPKHLGKCPF